MKHALLAALLLMPALALAEVPPPPLLDDSDRVTRELMEPTVTIIRRDDGEIIEEYRVQGQLYMVRITPTSGPAYYLVDTDGDGNLESRSHELDPRLMIPAWTILRW